MIRAGAIALIALFVLCNVKGVAASEIEYTPEHTLDAIEQASRDSGVRYSTLYRIVACETGRTFNPYARGRAGELGAVQLHPRGALRDFYAAGYENPYNPYEAVYFLAEALAGNRPPLGAWTWSCK